MQRILARSVGPGVQVLFALVLPLAILPIALTRPSLGWVAAIALALIVITPIAGLANTALTFIVVGFATVTFNDVHPIGALRWMELCDPFLLVGFLMLVPQVLGTRLHLPTTFLVGAIGFLTVGLLSALATDNPMSNLSYLWDVARGLIFLPIFLAWWQPTQRTLMAVAASYMFGNCINVVAALLEGPTVGESRYAGLTTHPNVMGICEVLSISIAPFLLATLPRRYHALVGVMAAIAMYGVWLTGSRAAFAGAVILAFLYPLLSRSIPAAFAVAAVGMTTFAVGSRLAEHADPTSTLGRLLGSESAQGSDETRLEGARGAIHLFLDHPFLGAGWLDLWGAHVSYLQVPAAIGVFGLVFYLMLMASIVRPLLYLPPPYALLATPALATIMLDTFLPILGATFIWIIVGLALNADRLAAPDEPDADLLPLDPLREAADTKSRGS